MLRRATPTIPSVVPHVVRAVETTVQRAIVLVAAGIVAAAVDISDGKCTQRSVPSAAFRPKYPSSQEKTDRYIAGTVITKQPANSVVTKLFEE